MKIPQGQRLYFVRVLERSHTPQSDCSSYRLMIWNYSINDMMICISKYIDEIECSLIVHEYLIQIEFNNIELKSATKIIELSE